MDADLERRKQELEIQKQELEIMEQKLRIEKALDDQKRRGERGKFLEKSKAVANSAKREAIDFIFYAAQIIGILVGVGMIIYGVVEFELIFVFFGIGLWAVAYYQLKIANKEE